MGETYVTAIISSPGNPERADEVEFLVDTGATDSLVPRSILERVGIVPTGARYYVLADGTEHELASGIAEIRVLGVSTGATVVFGDDDWAPLLGLTVMESAGLIVDPKHHTVSLGGRVRL